VPWAAVRVNEASMKARLVLLGHYRSARCDTTSQGDLKLTRIPDRAPGDVRLSVSNEPVVTTAGAFGSGSDNLRAMRKTATLHCSCFGAGLSGHVTNDT
jgi:hypothetical protein